MSKEPLPPSNFPIYLGLIFLMGVPLTCVAALIGPNVVYVIAAVAFLVIVGGVHYLLWGRGLHDDGEDR